MHLCYALSRASAPATEPLTLDEVKLYLRVDHTDEDSLLSDLITTVREAAEHYLRRSLITQSWQLSYNHYVPSPLSLPMGPVQTIETVKTITRDDVETILANGGYYLAAANEQLVFDTVPDAHVVEIRYITGYGDAASDIPKPIHAGMLSHLAALYANRTLSQIPADVQGLYNPYRVVAL